MMVSLITSLVAIALTPVAVEEEKLRGDALFFRRVVLWCCVAGLVARDVTILFLTK